MNEKTRERINTLQLRRGTWWVNRSYLFHPFTRSFLIIFSGHKKKNLILNYFLHPSATAMYYQDASRQITHFKSDCTFGFLRLIKDTAA